MRASIRTLAQGNSFGHQGGRMDSLPQPGFPLSRIQNNIQRLIEATQILYEYLRAEYFNINGMNALSWAWVIFSTGVGIPSIINGGNS